MAESIRTCIACGQKRNKKELIRIVKTNDQKIQLDEKQKKEGRGAYICPNVNCIQKAKKYNLISRVFQEFNIQYIYLQIAQHYKNKTKTDFEKLIGFIVRARKCTIGIEAIQRALKNGKMKVLILDPKCSQNTQKKMRKMEEYYHIPIIEYFGSQDFEKLVGKTNCHCIGISDLKFANQLLNQRDQ